jgi:hypothetical protein
MKLSEIRAQYGLNLWPKFCELRPPGRRARIKMASITKYGKQKICKSANFHSFDMKLSGIEVQCYGNLWRNGYCNSRLTGYTHGCCKDIDFEEKFNLGFLLRIN